MAGASGNESGIDCARLFPSLSLSRLLPVSRHSYSPNCLCSIGPGCPFADRPWPLTGFGSIYWSGGGGRYRKPDVAHHIMQANFSGGDGLAARVTCLGMYIIFSSRPFACRLPTLQLIQVLQASRGDSACRPYHRPLCEPVRLAMTQKVDQLSIPCCFITWYMIVPGRSIVGFATDEHFHVHAPPDKASCRLNMRR